MSSFPEGGFSPDDIDIFAQKLKAGDPVARAIARAALTNLTQEFTAVAKAITSIASPEERALYEAKLVEVALNDLHTSTVNNLANLLFNPDYATPAVSSFSEPGDDNTPRHTVGTILIVFGSHDFNMPRKTGAGIESRRSYIAKGKIPDEQLFSQENGTPPLLRIIDWTTSDGSIPRIYGLPALKDGRLDVLRVRKMDDPQRNDIGELARDILKLSPTPPVPNLPHGRLIFPIHARRDDAGPRRS